MIEGSCLCAAVRWTFDGTPDHATACNCTACRRYGVLWGYDYERERINVTGPTRAYYRSDASLGFHFCTECGCVTHWLAVEAQDDGRRRIAVNLRLAEPDAVADIPVEHLDAFDTWEDIPRGTRTVGDMWF